MLKISQSRLAKLLVGVFAISILQFASAPTWAADCAKAADAKLSVCTKATAKPGAGSQMQTVPQASAAEQKKVAQSNVDTKTATAQQKPMREKRNWVGTTQLSCKKGSMTLHVESAATPCPPGFQKS